MGVGVGVDTARAKKSLAQRYEESGFRTGSPDLSLDFALVN